MQENFEFFWVVISTKIKALGVQIHTKRDRPKNTLGNIFFVKMSIYTFYLLKYNEAFFLIYVHQGQWTECNGAFTSGMNEFYLDIFRPLIVL